MSVQQMFLSLNVIVVLLNKVGIVYVSYTNNTKNVAEIIAKTLVENDIQVDVFSYRDTFTLNDYDLVFIGSFTWADGKLPIQCRKLLKKILIDSPNQVKHYVPFGTGDTQWGELYCKGVDEIEYHLKKYSKSVINKLKIEQNPVSTYKKDIIKDFVNNILKEVEYINDK